MVKVLNITHRIKRKGTKATKRTYTLTAAQAEQKRREQKKRARSPLRRPNVSKPFYVVKPVNVGKNALANNTKKKKKGALKPKQNAQYRTPGTTANAGNRVKLLKHGAKGEKRKFTALFDRMGLPPPTASQQVNKNAWMRYLASLRIAAPKPPV